MMKMKPAQAGKRDAFARFDAHLIAYTIVAYAIIVYASFAEYNHFMKSAATIPFDAENPRCCTNLKLRQLTRRVTQHYEKHFAGSGLKITQYSLLTYVYHLGPLQPSELARHMEMDLSTLSRNMQPLITAGWIEMTEGVDARSRLVGLTDAGREMRREGQRRWKTAQLALNEKLGVETVTVLHALLDQGLAAFHDNDAQGD